MSSGSSAASKMSRLELDQFHSVDRKLYVVLAIHLMRDPVLALHIMSLWMWLENNRFIETVTKIYELPLELISGLADEAVVLIKLLSDIFVPTPAELINLLPLLHFLMRKEPCLLFFRDTRVSAVDGIRKVFSDICVSVMEDLYKQAVEVHNAKLRLPHYESEVAQLAKSFQANLGISANDALSSFSTARLCSPTPSRLGRLGSSSFLNSSSSTAGNGAVNLIRSTSLELENRLPKSSLSGAAVNPDPVFTGRLGSPKSTYGYVGMERTISKLGLSNSSSVPSKRSVGAIGERLTRSMSCNAKFDALNPASTGQLILNPSMGSSPSFMPSPLHPVCFPIPQLVVPPQDRSLFVTFSKGYWVTEEELHNFIVYSYGPCVESIHMQETQPGEQPLYARIVFHSPESIYTVLNGEAKAKFTINGKHVWARKFIAKFPRPSQS